MSDQAQPIFTRKVPDPTLADLIAESKRDIMLSLNCHALATIQDYDSENQTVSCTINYNQTYLVANADGTYQTQGENYPPLTDVPVMFLGGGSGALTFPISKGDQALIIFNDRDLNNWFAGALSGPVATNRLHSFSDAIALVGLSDIDDIDPDRVVLRNGTGPAKIAISTEGLFEISNAETGLFDILNDLMSALLPLVTAMSTATPTTAWEIAVTAAAGTALTALTAVQTLIPELLE